MGDDRCPHCNTSYETIIHVLRDCSFARIFWVDILEHDSFLQFLDMPCEQWISQRYINVEVGF